MPIDKFGRHLHDYEYTQYVDDTSNNVVSLIDDTVLPLLGENLFTKKTVDLTFLPFTDKSGEKKYKTKYNTRHYLFPYVSGIVDYYVGHPEKFDLYINDKPIETLFRKTLFFGDKIRMSKEPVDEPLLFLIWVTCPVLFKKKERK